MNYFTTYDDALLLLSLFTNYILNILFTVETSLSQKVFYIHHSSSDRDFKVGAFSMAFTIGGAGLFRPVKLL